LSDTDYQLHHLTSATKKLTFEEAVAVDDAGTADKRTIANTKTSKTIGTLGTLGSNTKSMSSDHNQTAFTQRQAKSLVAAREILKKGKKYHFRHYETRSDQLLQESIASLAR